MLATEIKCIIVFGNHIHTTPNEVQTIKTFDTSFTWSAPVVRLFRLGGLILKQRINWQPDTKFKRQLMLKASICCFWLVLTNRKCCIARWNVNDTLLLTVTHNVVVIKKLHSKYLSTALKTANCTLVLLANQCRIKLTLRC